MGKNTGRFLGVSFKTVNFPHDQVRAQSLCGNAATDEMDVVQHRIKQNKNQSLDWVAVLQ